MEKVTLRQEVSGSNKKWVVYKAGTCTVLATPFYFWTLAMSYCEDMNYEVVEMISAKEVK